MKKNIYQNGKTKEVSSRNLGITLIALVVTIVVLLILAAVSITAVFGDNGLLKLAEEAKRKTLIAQKEQEVSMAITDLITKYLGDTGKITVEEVVEKVKKNYKKQEEKDSITGWSDNEDNKFPGRIEYDRPSSGLKEKIVVTVDENLNITSDIDSSNSIPGSSYTKVGKTYCNSPDVSKFNKAATYYITYDADGNESIYGRIDKVEPPEDWYDYGEKRWANIVTVTDNDVAYWVWIPRYKYQTNSETQTIDAKFVTTDDIYIEIDENGQEQEMSLPEYKLPESFTFAGKQIPGYWASKYEVQDSSNNEEKILIITDNSEEIITSTAPSGTYTIYANGEKVKTGVNIPYNVNDLGVSSVKDVVLVSETRNQIVGRSTGITSVKIKEVIDVDTSGFNPEATYYITYDDAGNESIYGRIDKVERPKDWYDYENKKWANLVTVTGNDITYWTYIPRYEYRAVQLTQYIDALFIPVDKTTPDNGFKIPESFTFAGKPIPGYWASKYEVQDSNSNTEKLQITGETITTTASNVANNTYTIYVNGEAKTGNTLPCNFTDLGISSSNKDICVVNETSGQIVGAIRDNN